MVSIGKLYLILHRERIPTEQRERIIKAVLEADKESNERSHERRARS